MAARGRQPGSLVRAKCVLCGAVELATGCGGAWRCTACRKAGIYPHSKGARWNGKEQAGLSVSRAIRAGEIPHPKGLACTDCGGVACEYEHRDYNHPLRVEPICRACNLRRGPAIPLRGTMARCVSHGGIPYHGRHSVIRIFQRLGLPVDVPASMPAKLTLEHWQVIAPLIEAAIPPHPAI